MKRNLQTFLLLHSYFRLPNVRLPVSTIVGAAGYHDLHDCGLHLLGFDVICGTGPVGTELDEFELYAVRVETQLSAAGR